MVFKVFSHHFVVQPCSGFAPVVFAPLQPPATIRQPSGLMHLMRNLKG